MDKLFDRQAKAKAVHRSPRSDSSTETIDRPSRTIMIPLKKSILKEIIAEKNLRIDT